MLIASVVERDPVLARILEIADSDAGRFAVDDSAAGLELIPVGADSMPANRCRMKVFVPRLGKERLCAFFYKRSNLAWSRDRFSYGGVEFRAEQLTDEAVRSWLQWLRSGFDPAGKPERLRRAFLYDIPE